MSVRLRLDDGQIVFSLNMSSSYFNTRIKSSANENKCSTFLCFFLVYKANLRETSNVQKKNPYIFS